MVPPSAEDTLDLSKARRIVLLGCSGSGKSTLARALGQRLGLPVVHLDSLFWNAGWQMTPDHEMTQRVEEAASGERWILDGNYSKTLEVRLERADLAVFLDLPRRTCLRRVLSRWRRWRGRSRPDLAEGCDERINLEFLRWVWSWNRHSRPKVVELLERFRGRCEIRVLKTARESDRFLREIP